MCTSLLHVQPYYKGVYILLHIDHTVESWLYSLFSTSNTFLIASVTFMYMYLVFLYMQM